MTYRILTSPALAINYHVFGPGLFLSLRWEKRFRKVKRMYWAGALLASIWMHFSPFGLRRAGQRGRHFPRNGKKHKENNGFLRFRRSLRDPRKSRIPTSSGLAINCGRHRPIPFLHLKMKNSSRKMKKKYLLRPRCAWHWIGNSRFVRNPASSILAIN